MKILNNRVVCSGCEEPFEVGQKFFQVQKSSLTITKVDDEPGLQKGEPFIHTDEWKKNIEMFHEGCD